MEKVLHELGMQSYLPMFRKSSISLKHFQIIMTPGASGTQRQIVMESTGLKPGQIMEICNHIEAKFGKSFTKM